MSHVNGVGRPEPSLSKGGTAHLIEKFEEARKAKYSARET
jgi:hypothetical protein